jgi:hypothetical protein
MPRARLQQFSEIRHLPPEILRGIDLVAANTLRHMKSLKPLKVELPSIDELSKREWPRDAVILARGPSFFRERYFEKLSKARKLGHRFVLLCADGVVAHCMDKGVMPDIVVTVDPSIRILHWLGDPDGLTANDEYFLKDRDAPREKKALLDQAYIIELLNKRGHELTVAVDVFTHENVLERLLSIGAKIFLYFPMSDDQEYMTEMWKQYPDLVSLSCGGNVGTAAYNLARFLGASRICLAGFDFGYPPGTPLEETQYYDLIEKNPELGRELFVTIKNPHLKRPWFTDRVYLGYAHTLLKMIQHASSQRVVTVNATGGGILFGATLKWGELGDFLETTPRVG